MKYDSIIGFSLFLLITIGGATLLYWLVSYLKVNYNKDWFKNLNLKKHLWDNTPLAWILKQIVGVQPKMAPKHAPSWYVPPTGTTAPPPAGRMGNAGNSGRLTAMKPYPKTASTSSLNVPPLNHMGKPLVIKNWDRITGFKIDVLGRSWFVVQAMNTLSGYECVLQSRSTPHIITFCIYKDMYDSHRITVFCKARVAHMDVSVCKDPQLLLDKVGYEFADKFDV
jgi:hypothetical protein